MSLPRTCSHHVATGDGAPPKTPSTPQRPGTDSVPTVDVDTPRARPRRTLFAVVALTVLVMAGCSTSGSDEAEQSPDSKVITTAMGPDDTTPSTVGIPDTTEAPTTIETPEETTPTTIDLGSENPDEAGVAYPEQVQTNFTTSCVANGGEEGDCRCLLDELTAQLSLNDFIALEAEMTESGETPAILNEAVQTCAG